MKKSMKCLSNYSRNCMGYFNTTAELRTCPQCYKAISMTNEYIPKGFDMSEIKEDDLLEFWKKLK